MRPFVTRPRVLIAALSVLVAGGLLAFASGVRTGSYGQSLTINLATGLLGVLFTVAIVDVLFERRHLQDRAHDAAWRVLHVVDYAVWVWQGGARAFSLGELQWMIRNIADDDELGRDAQNLLMEIGGRCANTLRLSGPALRASPHLKLALQSLAVLGDIRSTIGTIVSAAALRSSLADAVDELAAALGLDTFISIYNDDEGAQMRDPSIDAQDWRHRGYLPHNRPGRRAPQ